MGNKQSLDTKGFEQSEIEQLQHVFSYYEQNQKWKISLSDPLLLALKQPNLAEFIRLCRVLISGNSYDRLDFFLATKLELLDFVRELVRSGRDVLYDLPSSDSLDEFFLDSIQVNQWDFLQLMSHSLHFQRLFHLVFEHALLNKPRLSIPKQMKPALDSNQKLLIDRDLLFVIDTALESDFPERKWRLLYSSNQNGKSWTILRQKLVEAESSVIIVKDADGKIFGGFHSLPFIPNPKFDGDGRCFVFSGNPLRLFRPTRINENFVYYNHGQQTLPNGIGFGGQIDYFGWFVSHDVEKGHSMAQPISTTYGNPQLTKEQIFRVDQLEVWCIVNRDTESIAYKKSVLDNPDMVAILEMSGKTMYSKQVKDEPVDEP
jgi:hypothetical protein